MSFENPGLNNLNGTTLSANQPVKNVLSNKEAAATEEGLITAPQEKNQAASDSEIQEMMNAVTSEEQSEATKSVKVKPSVLAMQLVQNFLSITVERWSKGSKGNSCLENIIKNNYDLESLNIKLYDEKYNILEKAVMDANPEIYGDENGNNSRKKIIDNTRHNAILKPGDVLKLPNYEEIEGLSEETQEVKNPENPETTEASSVTKYNSKEELSETTKDLKKTDLGKYLNSIDEDNYAYTNYNKDTGEYKVTTYIKDKNTDALRQILFDEDGTEIDIFEMRADGTLLTKEEVDALEQ